MNVGDLGGYEGFHRLIRGHHARHSAGETMHLRVVALPAGLLFGHIGFPDGLVFRGQRRLLRPARTLARIERTSPMTLFHRYMLP